MLLLFSPKGLRGLLGPNPVYSMGEGQGTPWMSRQLIAGPLLMPAAHREQFWGSVTYSRILRGIQNIKFTCKLPASLWPSND